MAMVASAPNFCFGLRCGPGGGSLQQPLRPEGFIPGFDHGKKQRLNLERTWKLNHHSDPQVLSTNENRYPTVVEIKSPLERFR